jgi:hypothetical protein
MRSRTRLAYLYRRHTMHASLKILSSQLLVIAACERKTRKNQSEKTPLSPLLDFGFIDIGRTFDTKCKERKRKPHVFTRLQVSTMLTTGSLSSTRVVPPFKLSSKPGQMRDLPPQIKTDRFIAVAQGSFSFKLGSESRGSKMTNLTLGLKPSAYCYHVCGRSSSCFNSIGNRRFRVTASVFLDEHSKAYTKLSKAKVVTQILEIIECSGGGFVTCENGRYYEVSEAMAREKVGDHLRDCHHGYHKSASKSMLARSKARTAAESEEETNSSSTNTVDDKLSIPANTNSWDIGVVEKANREFSL